MADDDNSNTTVSGYVPLYNPVPVYDDKNGTAVSTAPICVSFKIATDKGLKDVVDSGRAYTSSDVDYTLKVRGDHLHLSQPQVIWERMSGEARKARLDHA